MNVFPNLDRRQAHIHLQGGNKLSDASLVSQEGRQHRVELHSHDISHYMLSWKQDLPAGTYYIAVRTIDGRSYSHTMRIH